MNYLHNYFLAVVMNSFELEPDTAVFDFGCSLMKQKSMNI